MIRERYLATNLIRYLNALFVELNGLTFALSGVMGTAFRGTFRHGRQHEHLELIGTNYQ